MSRKPVHGRQGPRAHAAVVPPVQAAPRLRVRQVRSAIGHPETMRRTLRSLGLRHHQQEVRVVNNDAIRGMIYKVRHLVEVSPAGEE